MAAKVLKVKLWNDSEGVKWKRNVQEIDGEILCGTPTHLRGFPSRNSNTKVTVSQFTLLASTKKANPSFHASADPVKGKELYDRFVSQVRTLYTADKVKDGVFQAMMDVSLVNDGPVGIDFRCIDEAVISTFTDLSGNMADLRIPGDY